MRSLSLAYRDDDRTPVIFTIREAAWRHYDIDVCVVKVRDGNDHEAALRRGCERAKIRPYPTSQAIINRYEITTSVNLGAKDLNPLTLWDLHWAKELDDAGFIDGLADGLGLQADLPSSGLKL